MALDVGGSAERGGWQFLEWFGFSSLEGCGEEKGLGRLCSIDWVGLRWWKLELRDIEILFRVDSILVVRELLGVLGSNFALTLGYWECVELMLTVLVSIWLNKHEGFLQRDGFCSKQVVSSSSSEGGEDCTSLVFGCGDKNSLRGCVGKMMTWMDSVAEFKLGLWSVCLRHCHRVH